MFTNLSNNREDLRLNEEFISMLESGYIALASISFTLSVVETLKFLMFFQYGKEFIEEEIMSSLKDPLISQEEGTEATAQDGISDFASLSASSDPLWWARSELQSDGTGGREEMVEDGARPPWVSLG